MLLLSSGCLGFLAVVASGASLGSHGGLPRGLVWPSPDAEELGHGGAGGFDRRGELLADLAQLGVQAPDVGQELGGELAARLGNRVPAS
jgi:hypothetical protein